MHRMLEIPEIMTHIFDYTDRASDAQCALVCRTWSDMALNALWYNVDRILNLFSLLAPISYLDTHPRSYSFDRAVLPNDWLRFQHYAHRVRYLSLCCEEHDYNQVFCRVAETRTDLHILPNLVQLTVCCEKTFASHAVMFLNPSLSRLAVALSNDTESCKTLFSYVTARVPNLAQLDIRLNSGKSILHIQDDLSQTLLQLTKLEQIILPGFALTPPIFSSLSTLPNLRAIMFQYSSWTYNGLYNDVVGFSTNFPSDGFQMLDNLHVALSIPKTFEFFEKNSRVTYLSYLSIIATDVGTATAVLDCLELLAETCVSLKGLYFEMIEGIVHGTLDHLPIVSYADLKAVLKFSKLAEFEFSYPRALDVTENNISEMTRHWPNLEHLVLSCDPIMDQQSPLTLAVLLPFAEHCPKLRSLYLHVDCTRLDSLPIGSDSPSFVGLEVLSFGTSPISEPKPVARFLSHILPRACTLKSCKFWSATVWDNIKVDAELTKRLEGYYNLWTEAANFLVFASATREFEEDRIRQLQNENTKLLEKIRLLESHEPKTVEVKWHCTCLKMD